MLIGKWQYEPNFQVGDTISYTISYQFDPEVENQSYLLRSDSGYVTHKYEDSILTNIESFDKLWISEYSLVQDSVWIVWHYHFDPLRDSLVDALIDGDRSEIELKEHQGITYIVYDYIESKDSVMIAALTDSTLVTQYGSTQIRHKKLTDLTPEWNPAIMIREDAKPGGRGLK